MIALAFLLGVALVASLGLNAYLTHRALSATDQARDEAVAREALISEVERAQFEREQFKTALAESERRESILQEAVSDAINATPNADLARNDVLGRVMRITAEWARAAAESRVPTEPGESVPEESAAEPSGPVVQPGQV